MTDEIEARSGLLRGLRYALPLAVAMWGAIGLLVWGLMP